MSIWLAAKQTVTAMDLVMRQWARALELDESGLIVLLLLGARSPQPAHELAFLCGRPRQQIHRSLRVMRRRGLVTPASFSSRGLVSSWDLTERGRALWSCLEPAMEEWDQMFDDRFEVSVLTEAFRRITELIVNRPFGNGWKRGLMVPDRLRRVSLESRAAVELALLEEKVELRARGEARDSKAAEEHAAAARAWQMLWR